MTDPTPTLDVADATAELIRPTDSSPFMTAADDGADLGVVVAEKRAETVRDELQTQLLVDRSRADDPPRSGDELSLSFTLDSGETRDMTAMVRDVTIDQESPDRFRIALEPAADFVFSILSFRQTFDNFEDEPVDDIIETVLERECPELATDQIGAVSQTTDLFADGSRVDDVVKTLIDRSDAFVASDGRALVVEPPGALPEPVTLSGDDHGALSVRKPDDGVANQVRVDGATDTAVDDANESQDSFVAVDEDSRETVQVETRKAQIAAVQVRTDGDPDEGDLRVRVQKTADGSPVAIDDRTSDIVASTEPAAFLATGGDFTRVPLPDHTLPEPDPTVIVETNGGSQDVGVDSTGELSYRVEFEFPLAVRERDQDSVDQHRRRQFREKKDNINTTQAARDRARADLRGRTAPRFEVSFQALSGDAFGLELLDTVTLPDAPDFVADRDLVIVERRDRYAAAQLRTELTALDPTTIS